MIAVIDYGAGNIKSVMNALKALGTESVLTADKETIMTADKVILPGVGAFGDAMGRIRQAGLEECIKGVCAQNRPFLGICLGLQLLFESSQESEGVSGLGILKGRILRIPEKTEEELMLERAATMCNGSNFCKTESETEAAAEILTKSIPVRKVPQIGWNDLSYPNKGRLFKDVPEHSYVYFVHSYYLKAEDPSIVTATTQYGVTIDASVEKGNIFACQFHPEKSEETGLHIIKNFLEI